MKNILILIFISISTLGLAQEEINVLLVNWALFMCANIRVYYI
jgi:hypothetical protein